MLATKVMVSVSEPDAYDRSSTFASLCECLSNQCPEVVDHRMSHSLGRLTPHSGKLRYRVYHLFRAHGPPIDLNERAIRLGQEAARRASAVVPVNQ